MNYIFDPSLVLYLPLHLRDGASFMSRDAYGHLCTVTGAFWTPQGHNFDGTDDNMNCGTHSIHKFTSSFTLEAWARFNNTGAEEHIISSQTGGTSGYSIYKGSIDVFALWLNGLTPSIVASNLVLSADIFYHLVGVYDSDTGKILVYIDANEDNSVNVTGSPIVAAAGLYLAKYPPNNNCNLGGYIGEVRIYNRALTPMEIQHNYMATKERYR